MGAYNATHPLITIRKGEMIFMAKMRVLLAYSGGLDTSIIVPWLKENYDCDVER